MKCRETLLAFGTRTTIFPCAETVELKTRTFWHLSCWLLLRMRCDKSCPFNLKRHLTRRMKSIKRPITRHLETTLALGVALATLGLTYSTAHASLGDAVDSPSLPWITGGNASWFSQTTTTHDGADAAESGSIINLEQTSIQTTVTGPGVLVFWWKVSSEFDFDFLSFYTNGVLFVDPVTLEEQSISGEPPWERNVYEFPNGTHTLRWTYEKDESISEALDRGWLDEVQFYTNNIPPIIPVQPDQTATAAEGGPASFTIAVLGTELLSYQWRRNGVALSSDGRVTGSETDALTIAPVYASDIGLYSVVVTNAYGSVTSNPTMLYTFDQVLDSSNLVWTHGGDAAWQGQTNETYDGVDAAISGLVDDNEISWIRASTIGPGTLSFWWKVDSELGAPLSGDGLGFFVDGTEMTYLSGVGVDWTNRVFAIAQGLHDLEWRYTKDNSILNGQDRGWLDQVTFIPDGPPPFSLSPSGFVGDVFQITLLGQPDQDYRLYSSSNLLDWIPIQTNSAPSGVVPFTDSSGAEYPHRYYRAETDLN